MTFIPNSDFFLRISQGLVPGHSGVNKFGANSDIGSGTTEDVWDGGGTYAFPSSASLTHVRSAVNSAITRSVSMEVQGLAADWSLTIQTVVTDAADSTTEVALGTALRRVFRVKINDDTAMDQDIQIGPTGFATQGAIVLAGNNQTLMAVYTVPLGRTAYMHSYYADVVATSVKNPYSTDFRLWVANAGDGDTFQLKHSRGIPTAASGIQHIFNPPMKINEKHDIKVSAHPSDKAADVHAGFNLTLIEN